MPSPKAVEQASGAVTDEFGRTETDVLVLVGENRNGEPLLTVETATDEFATGIEATLSRTQLEELRDGLTRLLDE